MRLEPLPIVTATPPRPTSSWNPLSWARQVAVQTIPPTENRVDQFERRSRSQPLSSIPFGKFRQPQVGPYNMEAYDYGEAERRYPDPEVSQRIGEPLPIASRGEVQKSEFSLWREEVFHPALPVTTQYFDGVPDRVKEQFNIQPHISFLPINPAYSQAPFRKNFKSEDAYWKAYDQLNAYYALVLMHRIGERSFFNLIHRHATPNSTPASPVAQERSGEWLKKAKVVGIPTGALGNFWGVVKYAMHTPDDAIHLKPFFEVHGPWQSLYGNKNWTVNPAYTEQRFVPETFNAHTASAQLKIAVDLLHAMGKTVGFDIPLHTAQFSDIVIANPELFEWMQLNDDKTKQLSAKEADPNTLYQKAQRVIQTFVKEEGLAGGGPADEQTVERLFDDTTSEAKRVGIVLGTHPKTKEARRIMLMKQFRQAGLELLPVPQDNPHRPIVFEGMVPDQAAFEGQRPTFRIPGSRPDQPKEPVFWDVTPYKLYETLPDGTPNLSKPHWKTWHYLADHVTEVQRTYGFDFLRADMGLLQHSRFPNHTKPNRYPLEIWAFLKEQVRQRNQAPYFATLGETFYAQAYDDPREYMDACGFDAALGYAHFLKAGTAEFLPKIRELNTQNSQHVAAISVRTSDFDNPEEAHKWSGNSWTYKPHLFLSYFLNNTGYTAMGTECNMGIDISNPRAFTHRFIASPKVNEPLPLGSYEWGHDTLKELETRDIRRMYDRLKGDLKQQNHYWLNAFTEKGYASDIGAWMYYDPRTQKPSYLMVVNTNTNIYEPKKNVWVQNPLKTAPCRQSGESLKLQAIYTTPRFSTDPIQTMSYLDRLRFDRHDDIHLHELGPGEGKIYKLSV